MVNHIGELDPLSWRGIVAPVRSISTSFNHDLVQHKKPGLDGARVENTGMGPVTVTATLAFRNNLHFETKNYSQKLFPDVYKEFVSACADTSVGLLVHPTLGNLDAKVQSFSDGLDASMRDGVDVNVTWIETLVDQEERLLELESSGDLSSAIASTDDLNLALLAMQARADQLLSKADSDFFNSLGDTLRALQAFPDQIDLATSRFRGAIDNVKYRLDSLQDSVSRMSGNVGANTGDVVALIEKIRASLNQAAKTHQTAAEEIKHFIVSKDMPIGQVASQLGSDLITILKLNPHIANQSIVKQYTLIKYT